MTILHDLPLKEVIAEEPGVKDIQKLVFSTSKFPESDDVRQWCRKNHFLSSAIHMSEDGTEWHVQQKKDGDFINTKRGTMNIAPGVSAITGQAREADAPAESKDTVAVVEMLKKVDDNMYVVMSADGKKQLSKPMSKEKARARLDQIEAFKKNGGTESLGLAKLPDGTVELCEGGRYVLREQDGDMARLTDGNIKKLRGTFVEKRTALRKTHGDMKPEDKYGSPEGSAVLDDLYYYNSLIGRLEAEMADRMLTLD